MLTMPRHVATYADAPPSYDEEDEMIILRNATDDDDDENEEDNTGIDGNDRDMTPPPPPFDEEEGEEVVDDSNTKKANKVSKQSTVPSLVPKKPMPDSLPSNRSPLLESPQRSIRHIHDEAETPMDHGTSLLSPSDLMIDTAASGGNSRVGKSSSNKLPLSSSASPVVSSKRSLLPRKKQPNIFQATPDFDRMELIFKTFIKLQNNGAHWLGANNKLTRLKFLGGIESILKLRMDHAQFDMLWTRLDYKRSGDISLDEFRRFFGDLNDFATSVEGQAAMSMSMNHPSQGQSKSMESLMSVLYLLSDTLRQAGFTIIEMFSAFDRNGSGEVSLSEFCSMLRVVIGNKFEKKLIYQALTVCDVDGNRHISLEELLRLVYHIWKNQLQELATKIHDLQHYQQQYSLKQLSGNEQTQMQKFVKERELIKQAIKTNFPRQWRDRLERLMVAEEGHGSGFIPGPFSYLLRKMKINTYNANATINTTTSTTNIAGNDAIESMDLDSPARLFPDQSSSPSGRLRPLSASAAVTGPTHKYSSASYRAGKNELMRFKIRLPAGQAPVRTSRDRDTGEVTVRTLSALPVKDATRGISFGSEKTESLLKGQSNDLFNGLSY